MSRSDLREDLYPAANARAAIVNRTHRVVRERALAMQNRKRTSRDLLLPCFICSAVLLLIATAVMTLAEENVSGWEEGLWHRIAGLGADAGSSISLLLVWFLPVSVVTAAVVMLRRSQLTSPVDEVRR